MKKLGLMETCRRALVADFGTLADLPYELANTIANVYYRFFALAYEPGPSFTSINASIASIAEAEERGRALLDYEFVRKVVPDMRQMIKEAHPSVVNVCADMLVSQIKYRIKDAPLKSPFRMKFERMLKGPAVKEIPNLVVTLGLR